MIVDSTRRGKSMSDALSKTIPIWCCVMNRALFPEHGDHELHTPPQAVSESEHAQIENRIKIFVRDFLDICKPDIKSLRSKIGKPLRPIWVTQKSSLPDEPPSFEEFSPVILCTASQRVSGAEGSEGGYIQGAADDHEAWSQGLTPILFWNNKAQLFNTNEEELPGLIAKLVREEKNSDAVPELIKPTSNLYVSSSHNLNISPFDVVINCGPVPLPEHVPGPNKTSEKKHHLWLECQPGKIGSRNLRDQLSRLRMLEEWLGSEPCPAKILVCEPHGKDLAVGVALAILCKYSDSHGTLSFRPDSDDREMDRRNQPDKKLVKERLSWITTTHPTLNPPRETLKSVNAYLMPGVTGKIARQDMPETLPFRSVRKEEDPKDTSKVTSSSSEPHPPAQPESASLPPNTPCKIFAGFENEGKPWKLFRELSSKLDTHPSGIVQGTATFTPLAPGSNSLLYTEEGEFITTSGLRMTVRRKYVYVLKEEDGSKHIAVHFDEEGQEIGSLFVEMGTLELKDGRIYVENREQHLCAADLYSSKWEFSLLISQEQNEYITKGLGASWKVEYDVKGPKKDYSSSTTYTRD